MSSKTKKTMLITILTAAIVLIAAAVLWYLYQNVSLNRLNKKQTEETMNSGSAENDTSDSIFYNGKEYVYNKNLTNVLFMGIDKDAEVSLSNMPGTSGQADCLMVISLDKSNETARVLQVSRDTMTDVDLFDVSGKYYTTVQAQIATQYAYGNGVQSSCFATKKTVSELLYDLPIDGYLSLNLSAISILNDAVGGVTVTVPEDYTDIDPAFTAGTTITLTGEQAEKYVRKRDITVLGSNNGRMQRQMQYIPALIQSIRKKVGSGGDYYKMLEPILEPYMAPNLSADQINQLGRYEFLEDETEYLQGEMKQGEHDEFYVDEENLQEILIKMFYIEK